MTLGSEWSQPRIASYGLFAVGFTVFLLHNVFARQAALDLKGDEYGEGLATLLNAMFQLGICAIPGIQYLRNERAPSSHARLSPMTWIAGIVQFLTLLLVNAGFAMVTVSMSQSMQAIEPIFTVVLAAMMLAGSRGSARSLMELIVVLGALGGSLYCMVVPAEGMHTFNSYIWLALMLNICSSCAAAMQLFLLKEISTDDNDLLEHFQLVYVTAAALAVAVVVMLAIVTPWFIASFFTNGLRAVAFLVHASLSGAMLLIHNYVSLKIHVLIPARIADAVNTFKRPLVVTACVITSYFGSSYVWGLAASYPWTGVFLLFVAAFTRLAVHMAPRFSIEMKLDTFLSRARYFALAIGIVVCFLFGSVRLVALSHSAVDLPALHGGGRVFLPAFEIPILLNVTTDEEYKVLADQLAGTPQMNLTCFGIRGNRGDLGLMQICENIFATHAKKLGLNLNVHHYNTTNELTLVVISGGSLIDADWSMQLWSNAVLHNRYHPRNFIHPMFFFGGGYDDNNLRWSNNREMLNQVIHVANMSYPEIAGPYFEPPDLPAIPIGYPSVAQRKYYNSLLPFLYHGGTRGPISSRIFPQKCRAMEIQFPASRNILGDAGIFAARYINVSYGMVERLGLDKPDAKPYVLFLLGLTSDGAFFSSDRNNSIWLEYNAIETFALQLIDLGYNTVFLDMSGEKEDAAFVGYVVDILRGMVPPAKRDMILTTNLTGVEEILGLAKKAKVVVAHKLHGGVFAGAVGTPFISIAYRMKHFDWALSIGMTEYVIHLGDISAELLMERFNSILQNYAAIQAHLFKLVDLFAARYENSAVTYLVEAAKRTRLIAGLP